MHITSSDAYLHQYRKDSEAAAKYARNAFGYVDQIIQAGGAMNYWERKAACEIAAHAHNMARFHYKMAELSRDEYARAIKAE
jgi:hypothetical protein